MRLQRRRAIGYAFFGLAVVLMANALVGENGYLAGIRAERQYQTVMTEVVKEAEVWAAQEMPAILDGETVHIGKRARVRFVPCAFRTLAPKVANPAISLAPEAQS